MKFIKIKSVKIKIFVIIIIIIYFLYIIHKKLFSSSLCSHLYNVDSFQTCALSNKICNITILLNSYIAYRTCIIEHSFTNADYVIFDGVNGLGNRILGLIAVTTYALVTSRVLLINWQPGDNHQASFKDLFLPLSLSDNVPIYDQYSLSRLANLIKNRWINEIESKMKNSRIPNDWAFYFDRDILCNDNIYNQSFGFYIINLITHHIKWIRTDQYFVPLFKRNKNLRQAFIRLFQNGQVFSELATKLLHPVPKVNSIIKDFQTKYNLENKILTIGVHMRSWSTNMINHIEPFQKCIEHVIKNINRSSRNETKIGLYIISNTRKRRQQLENHITKMYKNLEIFNSPEPPETANVIEQMQYTLAELLILSKMQHLIITSKSTFGMIAQGLARKGAWIVRQGASHEIQTIKSDLCEWESTSEPEYQMMGSLQINDTCSQYSTSLPSIGERTII
ncbi:unnamed protein product [Rotaria sordida]|uniref:Fucosyltransferase n=1 Tax=Rotaria sordida TaxID=392033 RepID=A0A819NBP1_9BILA|nr:unnamed protein product [Rotaria sordida]CAF1326338.1 unnamed protein product [Rotaria sordida]CAF1359600.1 unnamed protein product [Rotaria sordida]CAF1486912.1 unnamed protein product [Rotaria sordida]CAF1589006.1 unnamed protein product [Rotaria sordida]